MTPAPHNRFSGNNRVTSFVGLFPQKICYGVGYATRIIKMEFARRLLCIVYLGERPSEHSIFIYNSSGSPGRPIKSHSKFTQEKERKRKFTEDLLGVLGVALLYYPKKNWSKEKCNTQRILSTSPHFYQKMAFGPVKMLGRKVICVFFFLNFSKSG